MGSEPGDQALVQEALKKCALLWLQDPAEGDDAPARAVWHGWVDGKAYLLTGADEQPDPNFAPGQMVRVVARSKDNRQRLVVVLAEVSPLRPADDDWEAATTELAKGRLNLPQPQTAAQRWAAGTGYALYRLTPTGEVVEGPGAYGDDSHRLAPVETPASTRGALPRVLHRRGSAGRPLS
jgi:hypothetical protein